MALTRKTLLVDAEQLAELASRQGVSESEAVRAAVEAALFDAEFAAAMENLRAAGFWYVDTVKPDEIDGTRVEGREA